jgi:hypothetical protein
MTYNGWTNYETWCVNLHIANTEGSQEYWNERAAFAMAHTDPVNDYLDARSELAETMQSEFLEKYEEQKPDNAILADLLRAALSEVNWHELARHYVDDVQEAAK